MPQGNGRLDRDALTNTFRSFASTQCGSDDCEFCADRPSADGDAITVHAYEILRLIPLAPEMGKTRGNA